MKRTRIFFDATAAASATSNRRSKSQQLPLLHSLCKRILSKQHINERNTSALLFQTPSDVADAMWGLLHARTHLDHQKRADRQLSSLINASFVRLCRRDVALVNDVMQRQPTVDVTQAKDGRAVNLLAYSLPKANCDEVLWEQLVRLTERGCLAGQWAPWDLKGILSQIGYWGAYPKSLIASVESYVAARVRTCSESDLSILALMLSSFHELHKSKLFVDVASRAVVLSEHLSAGSISRLVTALLRAQHTTQCEELVKAFQSQGIRFAEDCDLHGAVMMFCYLATVSSQRGGVSSSVLDSDVLKCVVERIVSDDSSSTSNEGSDDGSSGSGGGLDIQSIMQLAKALKDFPKDRRRDVRSELDELLQYVSREVNGILTAPSTLGGLFDSNNLDLIQAFLSRYLQLVSLDRRALKKHLQEEEEKRKRDPTLGNTEEDEFGMDDEGGEDAAAAAQQRAAPHKEVISTLQTIATFVEQRVEELVSSENPPFSLIPRLLHCPAPEARNAALMILRETALQNISLPTLQTYQFLLALGDYKLVDKRVYRHLRNQFAQTVSGIPMIQLCAALKCFVRGLDVEWVPSSATQTTSSVTEAATAPFDEDADPATTVSPPPPNTSTSSSSKSAAGFVPPPSLDDIETQVKKELEMEDLATFLEQCHETITKAFSDGVEVRCVMALIAGMYQLGYKQERFYDEAAAYLVTKIAIATPSIHSVRDATVVREALGGEASTRLAQNPRLAAFFDAVVAEGTQEDHLLTPSQWMNLYDPANHITPLTEEQQRGWEILNQMSKTRSADTDKLTALATEYVTLLTTHRPDDLKAFFAMFQEKVFKNDKILKNCMDHLCDLGIVTKFSGSTIASILHSLAGIRFTYHVTMKRFLLAISEEQWSQVDASVLVSIVAGMSKLSLRIPGILIQISERLAVVCKFLSPIDTALLVNSFQSLGFHDDAVLGMLMQHASKSAKRFDEVALTLLFGSTSIHRLMTTPETSLPLLEKASVVKLPINTKQKILNSLKRSSLPRELVQSSSARVAPELTGAASRLQLEATTTTTISA
ncbi:Hypothetical protein, putative [Bodo saltans]|uniref:Mitochondrial RNA binding complex 1 subunit n=1 Tax=Bodo saltans TaxID=75058 RepID=A0A0S4JFF4_BODSA|nr:Hypothetical protein, putative [Bodo saltans]|eukprot:CUG90141.1 Hypothetical protein, putative [Bodo saltans]